MTLRMSMMRAALVLLPALTEARAVMSLKSQLARLKMSGIEARLMRTVRRAMARVFAWIFRKNFSKLKSSAQDINRLSRKSQSA